MGSLYVVWWLWWQLRLAVGMGAGVKGHSTNTGGDPAALTGTALSGTALTWLLHCTAVCVQMGQLPGGLSESALAAIKAHPALQQTSQSARTGAEGGGGRVEGEGGMEAWEGPQGCRGWRLR